MDYETEDTYPFGSYYTIRYPKLDTKKLTEEIEQTVKTLKAGGYPDGHGMRQGGGVFLYRAAKELLLRGEINVSI